MAVASDISILFLNVAGLITTSSIAGTNSADSAVELVDFNKLSCLQNTIFKNNDIIWVSETKQVTEGQLPKSLDPNKITIYSNAQATDKGAGLALLYNPLLPSPIDLLNEYLLGSIPTDKIRNLLGRFGIFAFILQDAILIVSCLYGSSHRGSKAADIIREATNIVCLVTKSLTKRSHDDGNKIPIINIWGGDFNAYPKDMSIFSYFGKSKPNIPKTGQRNVFAAMDDLAAGDGSLRFSNMHFKRQPSTITHGYYTNITTRNGVISTKTGIDHIYVSSDHLDRISSFNHFPVNDVISSHHALNVRVDRIWRKPQLKSSPKSMNYIPAYVFRNKNFISKLKIAILECVGKHKPKVNYDPALLYDHLMMQLIPSMARKFHRIFMSDFNNQEKEVKLKLKGLMTQGADKVSHTLHSSFLIVKANIAANCRWRLINLGHSISDDFNSVSPINDDEDDETPNLKWLKKHDAKSNDLITKIIPGIALNPHKNVTSNDNITNCTHRYFRRQYSSKPKQGLPLTDFLGNADASTIPSISAEDSSKLDKAFTCEEILIVINEYSKKKRSSPGYDGLPVDLFTCKDLQDIIVNLFLDVLNHMMLNDGSQPLSLSTALVRLLLKDGKSRVNLDSYRPITLMSIALRIMLRVITLRLTPFLSNLIGEHQKAYVPGRRGDHGVFLLSKIIHDAAYDDESESMILQLDFKRAFDSVYHTYVREVLAKFGVGPKLTNLIILIMGSLNVQVIVNDQLTKPIKVGRGLPQGSSLSAILFILCIEPLLRAGLTSGLLRGISLRGIQCTSITTVFYLAYADDLQLLIRSIADLIVWFNLLLKFALTSGLNVNIQKSALQLVGHKFWSLSDGLLIIPSQFSQDLIRDIVTSIPEVSNLIINIASPIKYCGVVLSIIDLLNKERANLMFTSWFDRSKKLTLFAKYINSCPFKSSIRRARYAKAKFLSLIQFLGFTSICPKTIANSIQTALNTVTFGKSKCPVALNIAVMPFSLGGYDHTIINDRFAALSTTWVTQYLNEKLPVCIDLIFKDSLQSIILRNIPGSILPLLNNLNNLSREHLIDASLQVLPPNVTSYAVRKLTSLYLIPPLNLAMSTLKILKLSRHWFPPDGGPSIDDLRQLLYEPIILNTAINIDDSPLPLCFTHLAHLLNLTLVRDLLLTNDVEFCIDIATILASDLTSDAKIIELRSSSSYKVGGSMRSSNGLYALIPRLDISPQLCNLKWRSLIPSALSFSTVKLLASRMQFNDINFEYNSYGKSLYPLQFSVNNGSDPTNFTWIRASHMTTKIITNALNVNNFYLLDDKKKTRQTCHCWTKYSTGLTLDWIANFKNLAKLRLPDDQCYYIDKVLLHKHVHTAQNNVDVMYNGASSWLSCIRCDAEQTPEHCLVTCNGVASFWLIFLDFIKLVMPKIYGKLHIITTKDILSLGTLISTEGCGPTLSLHIKSFVATLFSLAIDAVTSTCSSMEYQLKLTSVLRCEFTHSIYAKFILRLNSYLVRLISLSLHKPHLMSSFIQSDELHDDDFLCSIQKSSASAVILNGGVPLYSEPTSTPASAFLSNAMHSSSRLKVLFDPFITDGIGDLMSTKLPHLSPLNKLMWGDCPFPARVSEETDLPLSKVLNAVSPLPLLNLATAYMVSVNLIVRIPLFTDGSCTNNGKRLAAAAYSCIFPHHGHLNESLRLNPFDSHSNNRAELMAILRGCTIFVENLNVICVGNDLVPVLEIYTDSLICFNYITTSSGPTAFAKAKNKDLLLKVYNIMRSIPRCAIYHVKAHTNSTDWVSSWNQCADAAAKLALTKTDFVSSSVFA